MLKIISIIALTFGLAFSAFAATDFQVSQLLTAQTDASADDETTEEYIDWTFE